MQNTKLQEDLHVNFKKRKMEFIFYFLFLALKTNAMYN